MTKIAGAMIRTFHRLIRGIESGPNDPVSPGQLGNALGPNIIKTLAERSGISEEELLKQLSQGVIDKLTPHGRPPTLAELPR